VCPPFDKVWVGRWGILPTLGLVEVDRLGDHSVLLLILESFVPLIKGSLIV
jgi:hypothetical protein